MLHAYPLYQQCVSDTTPSTSIYYAADSGTATFALNPESDYIVYAIWARGVEILYSILGDERASYPKWFPLVLFEVIDGRLPILVVCTCTDHEAKSVCFLIAFRNGLMD